MANYDNIPDFSNDTSNILMRQNLTSKEIQKNIENYNNKQHNKVVALSHVYKHG